MKRGRGIKVLDDRSSGMEILIPEDIVKINPTDPLILAKQAPDSFGRSLVRVDVSR